MADSAAATQLSETTSNDATLGRHAADTPLTFMTLDLLRASLQQAGYRVETVGDGNVAVLRSASNGLGFDVRPGNSLPGVSDQFVDAVFVALFAVRGTFPLDLVDKWNRTHRFGRLFLDRVGPDQEFLVLAFDVSVAGGVTALYLRGQIEIWDRLVQQLVPWLREELSKIAPTIDTAPDAAGMSASSVGQPANA
jgi:hypothetical protein